MVVNKNMNSYKDPCGSAGIFCFKTGLSLFLIFFSFLAFSQASLKFTESKKSFGTVKQGEVVVLEYEFTNTGKSPLIINETQVECSCTTVEFPKQPIAPAQSGKIVVRFDTKTTWDLQDRVVKIYSNAKGSPDKIRFRGTVKKPS